MAAAPRHDLIAAARAHPWAAANVARFLDRAATVPLIHVDNAVPSSMAVSAGGRKLLVSMYFADVVQVYDLGRERIERRQDIRRAGARTLHSPEQVCVAPDGAVFIAHADRECVAVLTPDFRYVTTLRSGWNYRQVLNLRNSPGQGTGRSWAVSRLESKFRTKVKNP
jgi:hypothetical protein